MSLSLQLIIQAKEAKERLAPSETQARYTVHVLCRALPNRSWDTSAVLCETEVSQTWDCLCQFEWTRQQVLGITNKGDTNYQVGRSTDSYSVLPLFLMPMEELQPVVHSHGLDSPKFCRLVFDQGCCYCYCCAVLCCAVLCCAVLCCVPCICSTSYIWAETKSASAMLIHNFCRVVRT